MFVHLHNHTHYSILDAIVTVKELVVTAKADNQVAIALTDHGVMFGIIEFYEKCKEEGIKPIIGCEMYIANGSRLDRTALQKETKKKNYFHLLLLAKNGIGYKNLLKLTSYAHTEGFYSRPRIDKELLEKYCDGLICTSACMAGIVPHLILDDKYEQAKEEALFYKKLFGEDFYIEIQNHHYDHDRFLIAQSVKLAKEIDVKVIATNDIHYLKKEDAVAHNVLLNIKDSKGKDKVDINNLRYKTNEFYFRTQAEMIELFKDYPDSISNTLEIADKCNLEIPLGELYMPQFPIPATSSAQTFDDYLKELVFEGLKTRYEEITDEVQQRSDYELSVIKQMKFPGYFLIVWDFIRAAKELGTTVGPGRGSAAGSIVAYALGITNIDPLKYDLLFERFLNPERVSMPDIDIDFNDETRDRVIDYVKNKYGEKAVAQIVTFGTLSSKAVIKDVGRVLGLPLDKVNKITKEIETIQGKVEPIATVKEKATLEWVKTDEKIIEKIEANKFWKFCEVLEDKNRNTGTHAAGVVIAPSDITDYVPLYKTDKTSKTQSLENVSQYEMSYLEKAGLVKMDFLGLRTLSIIERALEMIAENYGEKIDLDKIDFSDIDTYKMIGNGQTKAIFQFESSGMQEYLKQLKPQNLEELTAMNALYRPGPMDNIPSYINRKLGKEQIKYLNPIMEKSLKNTYGVIVYQEQVMQLVQDLAGFSLGEADVMRRAMGKKKKEVMIELKEKFAEGCKNKGIQKKVAEEIFDLILKFASYGFNKSHSLAYSYLAFQTAWLKTHYTAEYLASFMTAVTNDQNVLVSYIDEAKSFNIEVLAPDVNSSNTYFVSKGKSIIFGMSGIKGVGTAVVDEIVEQRREKKFTSIFDFAVRVQHCNKRVLEALICSGAFDSIYSVAMRSQLNASVDLALEFAKNVNTNNKQDSADLFADSNSDEIGVANTPEPKLIFAPEWEGLERINKEKEFLNFFLSGHPLDRYYSAIKSFNSVDLTNYSADGAEEDNAVELQSTKFKNNISTYGLVSGLIVAFRTREDKRGNKIAFATIQNYQGTAEIAFWSDIYSKYSSVLEADAVICCQGRIEKVDGETKVTADGIYKIEEAILRYSTAVNIGINLLDFNNSKLDVLKNYISQSRLSNSLNPAKIVFFVHNFDKNYAQKYSVRSQGIGYNLDNLIYLSELFGKENVALSPIALSQPASNHRNWRN